MEQIIISNINKSRLYCEVNGQGKPFLFIHGLGVTPMAYRNILGKMGEKYTVYAVHLPGLGFSSNHGKISMDSIVDILYKFVSSLGHDKYIGLGHSLGGGVLIKMRDKYPELFSKIYLVNSAGLKIENKSFIDWTAGFFVNLKYNTEKAMKDKTFRKLLAGAMFDGVHLKNVMDLSKIAMKLDLQAEMKRINIPTKLIWASGGDAYFPPDVGRKMKKLIPGSKLKIVDATGHNWFLDKADLLIKNL